MAHAHSEYHTPVTYTVELGDRGRLVLPAALRRQLNLRAGERLLITLGTDGSLRIIGTRQQLRETRGIYRHLAPKRSLVRELLKERREEAARERAKGRGHGTDRRP